MSVWVTGDIHGEPYRFSVDKFPIQTKMNKNDYVIILGDFGLVWDYRGENATEKYWLDWLNSKNFTTLFIDGNHENFDRLNNYPVKKWHGGKVHFIRDSVIHLMRGQIFTITGKTFFTFGGASSHDISDGILEADDPDLKNKIKRLEKDPFSLYRINHMSWWERELPTENEMQEGLDNLKKHGNCVDFILTHCPYALLLKQMGFECSLYKRDFLTNYLQEIKNNVNYKRWIFGHVHCDKEFHLEKSTCKYIDIERII